MALTANRAGPRRLVAVITGAPSGVQIVVDPGQDPNMAQLGYS